MRKRWFPSAVGCSTILPHPSASGRSPDLVHLVLRHRGQSASVEAPDRVGQEVCHRIGLGLQSRCSWSRSCSRLSSSLTVVIVTMPAFVPVARSSCRPKRTKNRSGLVWIDTIFPSAHTHAHNSHTSCRRFSGGLTRRHLVRKAVAHGSTMASRSR